jgi:Leucine-rich repeat (LRR) protein
VSNNDLKELPKINLLENLTVMNLKYNLKFNKLPETLPRNIKKMILSETDISELPESISQLQQLEKIYLTKCYAITEFPIHITKLKSLKILDMSFTNIVKVPDEIGNLLNLENLYLNNCYKLTHLSRRIVDLVELKKLIVLGSSSLVFPPYHISNDGLLSILGFLNGNYEESDFNENKSCLVF